LQDTELARMSQEVPLADGDATGRLKRESPDGFVSRLPPWSLSSSPDAFFWRVPLGERTRTGRRWFRARRSARFEARTEAAIYRLKRFKYLVCNIYDATLKIIAVAKVKANNRDPHLQLHRLAGGSANGLSATGAWAILVSLDGAAADDSGSMRLMLKTSETFVRHGKRRPSAPPWPKTREPRRGGQGSGLPQWSLSPLCRESATCRDNPDETKKVPVEAARQPSRTKREWTRRGCDQPLVGGAGNKSKRGH
jgi:hypothetical protein